jgi:hypothetical protein
VLVQHIYENKQRRDNTYDQQQVRVPIQDKHSERVQPLPHLLCTLGWRKTFELLGAFLVNRLGLQEEAEHGGSGSQGCLEPEDVAPAAESHYYATDEGT